MLIIIIEIAKTIDKKKNAKNNKRKTNKDKKETSASALIDKSNSKFDLKIKKALHINWGKPNLNAQQNHLALTLSL